MSLTLRYEIDLGTLDAPAWTDISGYVRTEDWSITDGYQDRTSTAQPATLALTLDNRDRRFSAYDPTGIWYGLLGPNTRARVTLIDGGTETVLLSGEIGSWQPRATLGSSTSRDLTVPIQINGVLRRLGQAAPPRPSPLGRQLAAAAPLAYWPLEDGANATAFAPGIDGIPPARFSGDVTLAADSSIAGSKPLPQLGEQASISAQVPSLLSTSTLWQVEFVCLLPSTPPASGNHRRLFTVTTKQNVTWRVDVDAGFTRIIAYDGSGTVLTEFDGGFIAEMYGVPGRVMFRVDQVGGSTVEYQFRWVVINGSQYTIDGSYTGTAHPITGVALWPGYELGGAVFGHLGVWNSWFDPGSGGPYDNADSGYALEYSQARMTRLAGEDNYVDLTIDGDDPGPGMEAQADDQALTLIQTCAAADGGLLLEQRAVLGLAYRTRGSLENQTPALVLDYTAAYVAEPLEPVDDDSGRANQVEITTATHGSATAEQTTGPMSTAAPPAGVGVYSSSISLSLRDQDTIGYRAGWELRQGTVVGLRVPALTVQASSAPADVRAALASLRYGDRIQLVNVDWIGPDPIDLMVIGATNRFTQALGDVLWSWTGVCVPYGPWLAGVADDADARADTDGSELAAVAAAADTELSVAVTAGPLWITTDSYPDDFPFDIRAGGEVMTVTAVTGTDSPQTFTVTRSVNGVTKAQAAGTAVELATPTYTTY